MNDAEQETTRASAPDRSATTPAMRAWIPAVVAGSVAALVRLAHVLDLRSSVVFAHPLLDGAVYDGWARGSAAASSLAGYLAPLQSWLLAFLYAINDGHLWPRVVQALLGAATVALVADLGRRMAGPVAGLAAGLLLALCWPSVLLTGELVPSTLLTALILVSMWLLATAAAGDDRRRAIAAALVLGLATLARPSALVLAAVLVLLCLRIWPRTRERSLGTWRGRGAVVLVSLALLPPLASSVVRLAIDRDPGFLAVQPAMSWYAGNHAQSDGRTSVGGTATVDRVAARRALIAHAEQVAGHPLRPSAVGRHYLREGLSFWTQQPGEAAVLTATKLRFLVGAGERGDGENLQFWRAQSQVLRWPVFTSWAPIFALGLVGLGLHRRRPESAWLGACIGLYALGSIATVVNEAARAPLTALLAIFAGVTIAYLFEQARARRFGVVVAVVLGSAGLLVVSGLDRLGFADDRPVAAAAGHCTLGDLQLRTGDPGAAAVSYRTALDLVLAHPADRSGPAETRIRGSLVRALFRLHLFDTAEQHLRVMEAANGDDVEVWILRGRYHLWQHDEPAAFPWFRRAVDAAPSDVEALVGLVWCQIHNKAWVAARQNIDRALALRPDHAEAIAAKGVIVLHGERNPRHAKQLFEDALRLDWETPAAHHYLGVIFNGDNNRARALYHFRETMRLDPNNEYVGRFLNRAGLDYEHPAGTTRPEL